MAIPPYITYMSSNALLNETNIIIASAILLIIIVGCGVITYMYTGDDDESDIAKIRHHNNMIIYNHELSRRKEDEFEEAMEDHPFAPKHVVKEQRSTQMSRELEEHPFSPINISKNDEFSDLMETSVSSSTNNNVSPYALNKQMKKEDIYNNYNMNYGQHSRPGTSPLQYNSDNSSVSNNYPVPSSYVQNYQIPITTNIPITSLPISTQFPITSQLPIASQIPISSQMPITSQMPISSHIPINTQLPMTLQGSTDDYNEDHESLHRSSSLSRKRNNDASSKSRATKPIKRSNSQTSFKNDEDSVKLTRGLSLSKSYDEDLVLSTSLSLSTKSNEDRETGNYKESRKRRPPGRVGPPVVNKAPTRGILKTKSRYAKYDKTNNETENRKDEDSKSITETDIKKESVDIESKKVNSATNSNVSVDEDGSEKNNKYYKYR